MSHPFRVVAASFAIFGGRRSIFLANWSEQCRVVNNHSQRTKNDQQIKAKTAAGGQYMARKDFAFA